MLDLTHYNSLGEALEAAFECWPNEICLIEADRERERSRLTYRQFSEAALSAGGGATGSGICSRRPRRHHHDQSAQVADFGVRRFFRGGVLVPLDYKLSAAEHLAVAGAFQSASFCSWNIRCGAPSRRPPNFREHHQLQIVWSPKRRRTPTLRALGAGRSFTGNTRRNSGRARAPTRPASSIPPARADGPKGCVLTHDNYLEQCRALTAILSVLARRALPEHPAHQSRHRFHGRIHRTVHRAARPWCICARCGPNLCAKRSRATRSRT